VRVRDHRDAGRRIEVLHAERAGAHDPHDAGIAERRLVRQLERLLEDHALPGGRVGPARIAVLERDDDRVAVLRRDALDISLPSQNLMPWRR
jgi:hypothetical protein